jgi:hypothetical protein
VLLLADNQRCDKQDNQCAECAGDDCVEQTFANEFADETAKQPIAYPTANDADDNVHNQTVARPLEEFASEKAAQATNQTCDDNAYYHNIEVFNCYYYVRKNYSGGKVIKFFLWRMFFLKKF